MTIRSRMLLLAMTLPLAGPAYAADVQRGKALHDAKCTACHDSSVYTRKNRFIHSRDALLTQVKRCSRPASAGWNDAQIQDVVEYLDRSFYKFSR